MTTSRARRTPSVEIEVRRTTTTASANSPAGASTSTPRHRRGRSTTAPLAVVDEGDAEPAPPPAATAGERYARSLASRKKDAVGHAYPPPPPVAPAPVYSSGFQNTSVNIANAFKAATSGQGGVRVGGRREDFAAPAGRRDDKNEGEDEGDSEEEENIIKVAAKQAAAPTSAGKKRKKNVFKDPSYKSQAGQSSSSEESELDAQRGGQKRTKVASDDEGTAASTSRSYRRRSSKPVDPPYRPDPASAASSDEYTPRGRHKSKGKGRTSLGPGAATHALARGVQEAEIWYGKKPKGRRGGRGSGAGGESEEDDDEEEDESEQDEQGDERDLGGMDPHEHDLVGDRYVSHERDGDGSATPPAVSYYLRVGSPSPTHSSEASRRQQPGPPSNLGRSPSPFHSNVGASTSGAVDPAFAAFDRSLDADSSGRGDHPGDGHSLSASFDDSVLRGSSYDFCEEERIVQALEAQKQRQLEAQQARARQLQQQQQQQQRQGGPPPTPGGMATPRPSTGAYPLTPQAAGASPVSAMRKRRLPGPPSMLGAGTPFGAQDEGEGEDGAAGGTASEGKWGRRCGDALRPLVRVVERARRKAQDPLLDWAKIRRALGALLLASALIVAVWRYDLLDKLAPTSTSSPPPPPFIAPDVPPDSLEGLIARLSELESAMGRLSSSSESDRQRSSHDRSAISRLASQLDTLETSVSVEQSRITSALERVERDGVQHAAEASRAVLGVKDELEGLQGRLKALAVAQQADARDIVRLEGTVSTVSDDVDSVKRHVTQVAKDVEAATRSERITQLALDAIAQKLPGKIAVMMDKSGRLEIDPAFWRVLKDAFVDKKAVERTVDAKLAALDGTKRGGLFGGSSSKEAKPPAPVVAAPPSWADFLSANEGALRAFVANDLTSRVGSSDAFLSKQQFLDLLRREIKTLKRDFENKAHDNFEQMGRELLNKVAKQDDMRRKEQQRAQPVVGAGSSSSSPSSGAPVTIKSSDGQNVTAVISSLVDSALLRYSKDVLARPDYALFTSGGRVIRSLTSPSYDPHPSSAARSALAWLTGTKAPRGRPPVTALHSDNSPGSCWPFAGQQGQLGIQLSRRVVPTDVTLEHISTDVALDGDVSSAPKDFEVWGIVEGADNVAKVGQYRAEQLAAKRAARDAALEAGSPLDPLAAELDLNPASLPPSANHVLLAVGAYDPALPSPVQTFPVTPAARHLAIPVQVVVVKVLSNHGEEAYTCLYRVRVSGTTEAQLDGVDST
ncbi:hypothetical protein JCM3775_003116 [Rhodotorula graminis]